MYCNGFDHDLDYRVGSPLAMPAALRRFMRTKTSTAAFQKLRIRRTPRSS